MSTPAVSRGTLATTSPGTTAIPVAVPTTSAGPAVGDWLVVTIVTTSSGSVLHGVTAPSGWATILAPVLMGSRIMAVYAKRRAEGDPASYAFTQARDGSALAVAEWGSGGVVDVTTWPKGTYSKGANLTTQTTPGLTGLPAGTLVLSLQGEATAATEVDSDITVAAPFTKRGWFIVGGSSPVNSVLLAARALTAAGDSGDAVSTWKNTTGNRGSLMLAVPPLPDTVVPAVPLAVQVADGVGHEVTGQVTLWDGTREVTVAAVEPVHGGSFVPDLDRMDRVWTMAHRGGSLEQQEHSARGYLACAMARVDVFEVSLAVTSDGVFVGAHDATANRTTSGLADGWRFDQHTWAEVQALVQDLPNRGGPAPYMRLEDLVGQWSRSHTIMVDPKTLSTARRRELMTYLATIPDHERRILGKFYTTGTIVADEFHAIGCKAWGYSYTADVLDGTTARTASSWDYLGLEYTATNATWATILGVAAGRRVLGHIVPTAADARAVVAKGAGALQVSGVRAVSTAY